jgi:hypothetical protein
LRGIDFDFFKKRKISGKGTKMLKIYVLPVPDKLQPPTQPFKYPAHNADYGIEQDFFAYLKHYDYLTANPKEAHWHYLPVFWTRYKRNVRFGQGSLEELKKEVEKVILNDEKTFTICQHKDAPFMPLGKTKLFLASRTGDIGIDAPLISSAHPVPSKLPKKKYLASFIGRFRTHPYRKEMFKLFKKRDDILILRGNKGEQFFVKTLLESYLSLCPRGVGGSSFRLLESMQLGVVPVLLGDLDTRPFKKFIDWDQVSFYSPTPSGLIDILENPDKKTLLEMGKRAKKLWKDTLSYQQWCKFVLLELQELK